MSAVSIATGLVAEDSGVDAFAEAAARAALGLGGAPCDVALVFAYDVEGENADRKCVSLQCGASDPDQDATPKCWLPNDLAVCSTVRSSLATPSIPNACGRTTTPESSRYESPSRKKRSLDASQSPTAVASRASIRVSRATTAAR